MVHFPSHHLSILRSFFSVVVVFILFLFVFKDGGNLVLNEFTAFLLYDPGADGSPEQRKRPVCEDRM